jgi:soluble lytic murein transglycosylase-like protein
MRWCLDVETGRRPGVELQVARGDAGRACVQGYRWPVRKAVVASAGAAALVALVAGLAVWHVHQPQTVPSQYRAAVIAAASSCPGLNPRLLAAQLERESGWDPRAVSSRGAQGLAQFMPDTWRAYGVDGDGDGIKDVFNAKDAIASAAHLDCILLGELAFLPGDRMRLMLAGYDAGAGAVITYRGVPPYGETRHYVDDIMARSLVLTIGP